MRPGDAIGDLIIEGPLGAGGFASLWAARGPGGREVAIKVLAGELAASDEALARFAREVELVRRSRSPYIVRVEEVGRLPDRRPYLVMERLRGEDLGARLERDGALPPAKVVRLIQELGLALDAVHGAGIVHRDIKAANVFLAEPGPRAVLLDFGIARPTLPGATITLSHEVLGTPGAMAPEQIAGDRVDARADVYALGALAYHMLTGQPTFAGQSPAVVQQLHRFARRPRPSEITGDRAADAAVTRAMGVDPAERFASAGELAAALAASLSETDAGERLETSTEPVAWIAAGDHETLERAEIALADLGFAVALDAGWTVAYAGGDGDRDALASALAGIDVEVRVASCIVERRAGEVLDIIERRTR